MSLGMGFGVSEAEARPSGLHSVFPLPLDPDVALSALTVPHLPVHGHASHHADNGLKFCSYNSAPIKCFP